MDEQLINEVLHQIQQDVEMGDVEALEEFLKVIINGQTKKYFIAYLSEQRATDLGYDLKTIYNDEDE